MAVDFHMEFNPQPFDQKIRYGNQIFLIGSCFTNHLSDRFQLYKFSVLQNPSGVLFNPISILNTLENCLNGKMIHEDELFNDQGLWHHWDFHSQFSHEDRSAALLAMNHQITSGEKFLKSCDWIMITLGSAFVYDFQGKGIVANCHKMPSGQFKKYLLDPHEIKRLFLEKIRKIKSFNPHVNIVFTVSPVRHLRDGLVENNRSKAVLFHAIDLITKEDPTIYYFPAYELIVDDLRDYRFYAEDMVHPNYLATQYVWEKFVQACIDGKTQEAMKDVLQLVQAVKHRPMHPSSSEHLKFKQKFLEKAKELAQRFPELDFKDEIEYFS